MQYTKVKPSRKVLDAIKAEIQDGFGNEYTNVERLILELLDDKRGLTRSGRINALQQVTA
jgi:hypothetical protein